MARLPFGWNTGPGGNPTGIGAHMRALDAAGVPFAIKGNSHAGIVYEAQQIAQASDVPHVLVFRRVLQDGDTYNFDVPSYGLAPRESSDVHWDHHVAAWPPELDPYLVIRETINEVDKNRADWVGAFCCHQAERALEDEYPWAGPGWAGGEPETRHWEAPNMLAFLRIASENRGRIFVATHEYRLHADPDGRLDLRTGYPSWIGRFLDLVDVCDRHNIDPLPQVLITEFGWTLDRVPSWEQARDQLLWAGELYAQFPDVVKAAFLWYLGPGWGGIADLLQPYIAPLAQLMIETELPDPEPPADPAGLIETLWDASIEEQRRRGISLNPAAGIQRAIFADGFVPVTSEISVDYQGEPFVIQAAEDLDGEQPRRIYLWLDGGTQAFDDPRDETPEFPLFTWPTEYRTVTQPFGANPEYYRQFGLPGHEGVDVRAPEGSKIFACLDGTVYLVRRDPAGHNYGIHVRIRHELAGGIVVLKTVYAHLREALVNEGDRVRAGQVIGLADNTGNSCGSHLHLTVKKDGATAAGETDYPGDIVDPTPYLELPAEPPSLPQWPYGRPLIGVHGRADGNLEPADMAALSASRVEAVKLLGNAQPQNVQFLRHTLGPDVFVMARLFADFRGRVVRPADFVDWTLVDSLLLYEQGVRYFEVHNEPNLADEGWGSSWVDGRAFAAWWVAVRDMLRPRMPEARFGFPGLSPGGAIAGIRASDALFREDASTAIEAADWVGVHCYWLDEAERDSFENGRGYIAYRDRWPGKLLFITEFSNPAPDVAKATKAEQYVGYYRTLPPYIGAAFSFVLSASHGFEHETWRYEDGSLSQIPVVIGRRP